MPRKEKWSGLFAEAAPKPLTAQDRTSAAAKLILDGEAKKREELTAKLRAARIDKAESIASASGPALDKPKAH
jgi:hypothetical protein